MGVHPIHSVLTMSRRICSPRTIVQNSSPADGAFGCGRKSRGMGRQLFKDGPGKPGFGLEAVR